jgi:demethylmenaquinone methyltransferase/2-methoxy-6-polyprenyl-1,4-benzoquinol methylase
MSAGQPKPPRVARVAADNTRVKLGTMDVEAHLRDPARKQAFVTPMFDVIAPRYDDFTRLFSLGMDASWKAELIDAVIRHARNAGVALDLACGTGDVAVALARALPNAQVYGVDASPVMIDHMHERLRREPTGASRVHAAVGDMMALSQKTASVDVVTASYGVRNVPDAAVSVREMARVLRPGGVLVTLDFYRPRSWMWRTLFLRYLSVAGNAVGWLWHRDPVVYGYIARSIDHFMSAGDFSRLLSANGFTVQSVRQHLLGGIALHVATRD